MIQTRFRRIGLVTKLNTINVLRTLRTLIAYLRSINVEVMCEHHMAPLLREDDVPTFSYKNVDTKCDLLIVVGGDGSLLHAARNIVMSNVPIVGVNRGQLGFLTDINPDELIPALDDILRGRFIEDERCMLQVYLAHTNTCLRHGIALNEIVFTSSSAAKMVEFEIYLDDEFVCTQRSDGIIIATPTGSTAYALSAGGPILHPDSHTTVMIPMFPHTLSSRPIVLPSGRRIKIVKISDTPTQIHCDGQLSAKMQNRTTIHIHQLHRRLRLIHPLSYNYYAALRTKLGWGQKLT